jgi:hypothetical protein
MAGGQSIYSGLQHALLNKTLYDNCCFRAYTGSAPSDPSKAVTGTFLALITKSGNPSLGITWATPTTNVLSKNPSEQWEEDAGQATGNIGWLRLSPLTDDGTEKTDIQRFDFIAGTYAQYEAEIAANGFSLITARFENTLVTAGQPFRVNSATLTSVLSLN